MAARCGFLRGVLFNFSHDLLQIKNTVSFAFQISREDKFPSGNAGIRTILEIVVNDGSPKYPEYGDQTTGSLVWFQHRLGSKT